MKTVLFQTQVIVLTAFISSLLFQAPSFSQTQNEEEVISEAQSSQILSIQSQSNQKMLVLFEELQELQDELNLLLISETATENQIRAVYEELRVTTIELTDLEFETRVRIREILPPSLRRAFAESLGESVRERLSESDGES